jgi:hypothetical protein
VVHVGVACQPFHLTPPSRAPRYQRPFVFAHSSADVPQQLIMRVLAHRPLDALDPTVHAFQFLQQHHVMHVIAGPPIGGGHEDTIKGGRFDGIPEMIQGWTIRGGWKTHIDIFDFVTMGAGKSPPFMNFSLDSVTTLDYI